MLRVETVMKSVLDQISPGSWIRLREIDTTDLRADGEFFAKMVTAGVYQPEEVKAILDEVLG